MQIKKNFRPKLFDVFKNYNANLFAKDLGAGITVSVVALPLAMAFAIASGLSPEAGLFTAIIAGLIISTLGGSKVQIGGPAGAFIVIVYGVVEQFGVSGLLVATFISGLMLVLMGLLRLGGLVRFIPVAVIIGFTNGIAVLIALSQIKDFFGLTVEGDMPASFFPMMAVLWDVLPTINYQAFGVAIVSLLIIVIWQFAVQERIAVKAKGHLMGRFSLLIPGSILALIFATLMVEFFHLNVDTIGSRFGGIPQGLPKFSAPTMDWLTVTQLIVPASTLAVLGAIESLLCARVADDMIRDRHDANQELMAQGVANMTVTFFGGMPATGTIARTVTNVKNGGNSPIAGIIHALCLLIVVLVAAPLAQYIPLSALAAILMFVAWNMGDWKEFLRLKKYRLPYRLTLLSVFFLTVIIDLTVAVQVGVLLACVTFIYRISALSELQTLKLPKSLQDKGIKSFQLVGSVFFGSSRLLEQIEMQLPAKKLILDMSGVIYIDSSGREYFAKLLDECKTRGIAVYLTGLREQPKDILVRTKWILSLGENYLYDDYNDLIKQLNNADL